MQATIVQDTDTIRNDYIMSPPMVGIFWQGAGVTGVTFGAALKTPP